MKKEVAMNFNDQKEQIMKYIIGFGCILFTSCGDLTNSIDDSRVEGFLTGTYVVSQGKLIDQSSLIAVVDLLPVLPNILTNAPFVFDLELKDIDHILINLKNIILHNLPLALDDNQHLVGNGSMDIRVNDCGMRESYIINLEPNTLQPQHIYIEQYYKPIEGEVAQCNQYNLYQKFSFEISRIIVDS